MKSYWKKIDDIKSGSRNFICLFIYMFIPAYNLLATLMSPPPPSKKSCKGVIAVFYFVFFTGFLYIPPPPSLTKQKQLCKYFCCRENVVSHGVKGGVKKWGEGVVRRERKRFI